MSHARLCSAASRVQLLALSALFAIAGCMSVSSAPTGDVTSTHQSAPAASVAPVATSSSAAESASDPRGHKVPSLIDATGTQDVSAELQSFIDGVPNGSTIVFEAGGTYEMGGVLRIGGRKGVTLEGNGATLNLTGPGGYDGAGIFVEAQSEDTTIRNLKIVGNHAAAGTGDTCCGREGQHGIGIFGSTNTLIENVEISRVGGDCFYVSAHDARVWADGVTVRDSSCRLTGRSGVGLEAGEDILVENSRFEQIGFMFVNIEPNGSHEGVIDAVIRDNWIGSYGVTNTFDTWFLAACDAPWGGESVVRDVTVSGNTVEAHRSGWNGAMLGLQVMVCGDTATRQDFTITNNVAKGTVDAPWGVMRFIDVRGVTVTGNTQPLSGGSKLATFQGSTNVTYGEG